MMVDVAFPFRFDGRGATASPEYAEHVRHMIEQVLFTTPGERVNRPTFGSGLLQMVFAPNSAELGAATQMLVQSALQEWLSDVIRVDAVEVTTREELLQVTVRYVLLQTSQSQTAVFSRQV